MRWRGSLGGLTDGIVATAHWFDAEPGLGEPYVAWVEFDPTIRFHFAETTAFGSVSIRLDDPNGAGGVFAPIGVTVNGVRHDLDDPAGANTAYFVNLNLTDLDATDTLNIWLYRHDTWVFTSELSFRDIAPVPLPAGLRLLLSGLPGFVLLRRR